MNSISLDTWEQAFASARAAEAQGEVPIGAAIYWPEHPEWGIITAGNTRESAHDPTGHAEILVLRQACAVRQDWRLSGAVMCVTLEPCLMCLAAIQQARVARVEFAAWDVKGGSVSLGYRLFEDARLHHRVEVQYVPDPQSKHLLQTFFEARRS